MERSGTERERRGIRWRYHRPQHTAHTATACDGVDATHKMTPETPERSEGESRAAVQRHCRSDSGRCKMGADVRTGGRTCGVAYERTGGQGNAGERANTFRRRTQKDADTQQSEGMACSALQCDAKESQRKETAKGLGGTDLGGEQCDSGTAAHAGARIGRGTARTSSSAQRKRRGMATDRANGSRSGAQSL